MVDFDTIETGEESICLMLKDSNPQKFERAAKETFRTGVERGFAIYINGDIEIGEVHEGGFASISSETYSETTSEASKRKGDRAIYCHTHPGEPFPSVTDLMTFSNMLRKDNVWDGFVIVGLLSEDLIQVTSIEMTKLVPGDEADRIRSKLLSKVEREDDKEKAIFDMINLLAEYGETCERTWPI
jgi:proteasome lid subunit RPN8/RPN11